MRYTKARLRANEFIKAKSSIDPFALKSNDFKLKRFLNVDAKIDHRR